VLKALVIAQDTQQEVFLNAFLSRLHTAEVPWGSGSKPVKTMTARSG
jgi:hypothetical protein